MATSSRVRRRAVTTTAKGTMTAVTGVVRAASTSTTPRRVVSAGPRRREAITQKLAASIAQLRFTTLALSS